MKKLKIAFDVDDTLNDMKLYYYRKNKNRFVNSFILFRLAFRVLMGYKILDISTSVTDSIGFYTGKISMRYETNKVIK